MCVDATLRVPVAAAEDLAGFDVSASSNSTLPFSRLCRSSQSFSRVTVTWEGRVEREKEKERERERERETLS
jgi:hypothetical protein